MEPGPGDEGERELRLEIESPLPSQLAVGLGNAIFVCGWCFHPTLEVKALTVTLGDTSTPAIAFGMPRPDVRDSSGLATAYRSGFWAIVSIPPRARAATVELGVSARLEDGTHASGLAGSISLAPSDAAEPPRPAISGRVAICMATYEPALDLFQRQIESIRAQTHGDWTCVISDDCSAGERFEAIREVVGDDPRFELIRNERRRGFYANFELALRSADPQAEFIALADQDDAWYPEKLEALIAEIGDATVAYSDARVVERDGTVRSETYWSHRPNNSTDLISLILANSIPGSAALYRREILKQALPFPPDYGRLFHDHWLAIMALAVGGARYLDRPLFDYVQHEGSALGHEARGERHPMRRGLRAKLRIARRQPGFFHRHWSNAYFHECCRASLFARVVLMRCAPALTTRDSRALGHLAEIHRSAIALAWIAGRRVARRSGRDETSGAGGRILRAMLWRRCLELVAARTQHPPAWLPSQAALPADPDAPADFKRDAFTPRA